MRAISIVLLGLLAAGCAATHPAEPQMAKGTLLLDGGGLFSKQVHDRIGTLLGNKATLCAVTTANRDESYSQELFGDLQGVTVRLYDINAANAQTKEISAALEACDGYYFEGGAPELLSRAFLTDKGADTPALAVIRRRYRDGALVAGSSAGAMIPGPLSLCECGPVSSIQALRTGNLINAPGFGLVSTPLDAHSFTYSHYGRELFAMAKFGWRRLVAVDERTAVEIPPGGKIWSIVGDGTVALITAPPNPTPDRLEGFDITLMTRGDRFDPQSDLLLPRDGRQKFDALPHAGTFHSYAAFDEHELNHLADMLLHGASDAVSWSRLVPSRTTLVWTPKTQAYSGSGQLITHLSLSVERVPRSELPPEAITAGYGAESRDWNVQPIVGPRGTGDLHTPTPTSAPGVEILRTDELHRRAVRSDAPLLINVLGPQPNGALMIGNSVWLSGSGAPGTQGDATERKLGERLKELTHGDRSKPIVFYCFSSSSWWSYDAAQRAVHLGYRNVGWYRGGITAWRAAGGALMIAQKDAW